MIQTTIARIIDPGYFVLAAGSIAGVTEGMEFVLYELSDHVFHPVPGEDLGQIELVKGRVKVTHVQEKICHARTNARTVTKRVNALIPTIMDPMVAWSRAVTVEETQYDKLNVEGAVALKTDFTVRVGDLARSLT